MRTTNNIDNLVYECNLYGQNPEDILTKEELYEYAYEEEIQEDTMNTEQFKHKYAFIPAEQAQLNREQYIYPLKDLQNLTWKKYYSISSMITPIMLSKDPEDKRKFFIFGKGGMKDYWNSLKQAKEYLIKMQGVTLKVFNEKISALTESRYNSFLKEIKESRFLTNKQKFAFEKRANSIINYQLAS